SVARAATLPADPTPEARTPVAAGSLSALLDQDVEVVTATGSKRLTWADLGVEIDPDEVARAGSADLAVLAARGALPLRVNREKAVAALMQIKQRHDKAPRNAYLDLEARKIHDDVAGQ